MMTPHSDLRRSAAELLAYALTDLFPACLLAGGGLSEFGFYYDVASRQPIEEQSLPLLEEKLRGIIKEGIALHTLDMMRENGAAFMAHKRQPLRAEAILKEKDNIIQLVQIDSFADLCPTPHIENASQVGCIKLQEIEALPDRIIEREIMPMWRVYGIIAEDKDALKNKVKALKAGSKHSHLRYAKQLGLFHEVKKSLVWDDAGTQLLDVIGNRWKEEHRAEGYAILSTQEKNPIEVHLDYFIYKCLTPNELPFRCAELRHGVSTSSFPGLPGAFALEQATADYANTFCRPDQLQGEVISSLHFIAKFTKLFGFETRWYFAAGAKASKELIEALDSSGYAYERSNDAAEGAPCVYATLIDQFGREWSGPSIRVDAAPLKFLGAKSKEKGPQPLLITRTLIGSVERFAAMLLEQTEGKLPLPWGIKKIVNAHTNGISD